MTIVRSRRALTGGLAWCGALGLTSAAWSKEPQRPTEHARAVVVVGDERLRSPLPDDFLGFNLNAASLDSDHWSANARGLRPDLVAAMGVFKGNYLRYPGGNISNHFASDWAVGEISSRRPQRVSEHVNAAPIRFGPREYFEFVAAIGARSWYTLNLLGWDTERFGTELPSAEVAAANARLAELRVQLDRSGSGPRLYHLGNELDRNRYEWPVEKYVTRCRDTMAAVKAVDPQARFVAFLRDFDVTYKSRAGSSRAAHHAVQVLSALPDVADVSLQIYYDRPADEGHRFDLGWRWRLVDSFLDNLARQVRRPVEVWITEHAQARDMKARGLSRRERLATTSGIGGAIGSADFIIGALRRPRIRSAFWHALGGGVWWDLFEPSAGVLRPTPAFHVFKLLREHLAGDVLACEVRSSKVAGYEGGYDVNAAAVYSSERGGLSLIVANRASSPADLSVATPRWIGRATRAVVHTVAATEPWPSSLAEELQVNVSHAAPAPVAIDAQGQLAMNLAPRSVSVIRLESSSPARS